MAFAAFCSLHNSVTLDLKKSLPELDTWIAERGKTFISIVRVMVPTGIRSYCGYGEFGVAKYQDGTEIPWAFSQRLFAEFVDELESETSCKYSSGSEIIELNPTIGFTS